MWVYSNWSILSPTNWLKSASSPFGGGRNKLCQFHGQCLLKVSWYITKMGVFSNIIFENEFVLHTHWLVSYNKGIGLNPQK